MNTRDRQQLNRWMEEVADGNRMAIDPLFQAVLPKVRSFAHKLVGNRADADDITQQVMINLFQHSNEFRKGADVLSWVFGMTAFECKTLWNRKARRREDSTDGQALNHIGDDRDFEANLETRQLESVVVSILGELSNLDRQALLAYMGSELRPAITGPAFRKRLERAKARLKAVWRQKHEIV